tara:strand:+ start:194608 stop:196170 length:1563 start_codon:yes stop_codon:yes gene_type:complete
MKKIITLLSVTALVFACGTTKTATTKTTTKVKADVTEFGNTITAAELKESLYIYASDDFEGRETGTPGQKKAIEFLKKHYVELGIPSPISEGDYFQEVPLEKSGAPKVDLSINNTAFKSVDDFISFGGSDGNLSAESIVYVGYGIEDDNYSSYTDVDVNGRVVLIKAGEPKNADGTYIVSGTTDATKWSNLRQEYRAKQSVAIEKGAKAILYYNTSLYGIMAQNLGRMQGRISLKETTKETATTPYFFFVNDVIAKAIVSDIDTNVTTQDLKTPIALNYKSESEELSSENVVAFLKGTEKPDEVIVISAHLDHEGIKNGEIYNGADDDGSGSVALLEIAEAFKIAADKGQGPKRSILFLHVTGEEKGLLGSRYYSDIDPIIPLKNTVADLNIDMIGRIDPKRKGDRNYIYLIGSDKLSTELHNISEEVNKKYMNVVLDYTYNDENDPNRFYYRSDHYNFAKNNIPVIFYFNGTHDDYHKPSDTPDKIEYDLLENRTRLVFYTAWELANRANRIVVDKATE